ncbi:hypothetical protein DPMN_089065 [Dreissena polymorpha]|uniref:Uncharacterized protein n=1 Tax=Dreissena polymorpha TaxID=45954 RepID=A0A9D4KVP2_DREPO|nr:hypothetical protein DPMN_089065 [Dreissena polymorpha]
MPSVTTPPTVKISTTTSATVEDKTPTTSETSSLSIAWAGESLVTDRTTILTTGSGNKSMSNTTESSSPTTTILKSITSTFANDENKTSADLVTTFMTPSTSTAINGDIVVIERTTIFATGSVNTPDSDSTESSVTKQQTDKSNDGQVRKCPIMLHLKISFYDMRVAKADVCDNFFYMSTCIRLFFMCRVFYLG